MTKRHVDKSHAEAMVWILEQHFQRITTLLDEAGVPDHSAKNLFSKDQSEIEMIKLTVEQRVGVLVAAIKNEGCIVGSAGYDAFKIDMIAVADRNLDVFKQQNALLEDLIDPEQLDEVMNLEIGSSEWPKDRAALYELLAKYCPDQYSDANRGSAKNPA